MGHGHAATLLNLLLISPVAKGEASFFAQNQALAATLCNHWAPVSCMPFFPSPPLPSVMWELHGQGRSQEFHLGRSNMGRANKRGNELE